MQSHNGRIFQEFILREDCVIGSLYPGIVRDMLSAKINEGGFQLLKSSDMLAGLHCRIIIGYEPSSEDRTTNLKELFYEIAYDLWLPYRSGDTFFEEPSLKKSSKNCCVA